jgi:predicted MFS family arabinose efflux permease
MLLLVNLGAPAWVACVMAASAVAVTRGIPAASVVNAKGRPLRDIADGLRYLVASPLLRSITITVALGSFAASAGTAMLVLYATQVLHVGAVGYGALLACLAVGWVASSFVVHRIVSRFGYSWSMRIAQICVALAQLLIAVVPPWPPLIGAVLVFLTSATLVWNVCSQSTRQRFTPSALLGRVLTSHRALAWGLTPLGALAGGLVAAHWSLRAVWWMSAAIQAVGAVIVWRTLSPSAFADAELEASRP